MASTEHAFSGQKDADLLFRTEQRAHVIAEPSGRMEQLVRVIGCAPEALPRWNKLLGDALRLLRGTAPPQDRIVGMLAEMEARVWTCFGQALRQDIGETCTADDIDAVVQLRMSPQDCAHAGFDVQRIHPRTTALYQLAQDIPSLADAGTRQLLATASRASAVLNEQVRGERRSAVLRTRCRQYLERFQSDPDAFLAWLNTESHRKSIEQDGQLIALAMRRLRIVLGTYHGVQSPGQDYLRSYHWLLAACAQDGIANPLQAADAVEVLRTTRVFGIDAAIPEHVDAMSMIAARTHVVLPDMTAPSDMVACFAAVAPSRMSAAPAKALADALLQKLAQHMAALELDDVYHLMEGMRTARAYPERAFVDALVCHAATKLHAATTKHLAMILHYCCELPGARTFAGMPNLVRMGAGRAEALAEVLSPMELSRILRSLAHLGGESDSLQACVAKLSGRGVRLLHGSHDATGRQFTNFDVSTSLWSMGELTSKEQVPVPPVDDGAVTAFVDALSANANASVRTYDSISATSVLTAFARIPQRTPAVHEVIHTFVPHATELVRTARDYSPYLAAEQLWALGRMGLADTNAQELTGALLQKLNFAVGILTPQQLARCAWAAAVLHHRGSKAVTVSSVEPLLVAAQSAIVDGGMQSIADVTALYHAQMTFYHAAHPALADSCHGNGQAWLSGKQVECGLPKSAAERWVYEDVQAKFGHDCVAGLTHYGFDLDIALRLRDRNGTPRLLNIETDGLHHMQPNKEHIDAWRDDLLARNATLVRRLPFRQDRAALRACVSKLLVDLHKEGYVSCSGAELSF